MTLSTDAPALDHYEGKKDSVTPSTLEQETMAAPQASNDSYIPNIIEVPDENYIQEIAKLGLLNAPLIDPTDHIAMRQWLKDVYVTLPKAPQVKRTRPPVPINTRDIPITYGADNHFRIRIYDPSEDGASREELRPALIMIHGGGWIHGYPEVDEDLSEFFASELRAVVVSVDYRLAPEHPFPAAHNDCFEALNWIFTNAQEYRINTQRVGVWGCSSGGNLAASLALRDSAENETTRIRHVSLVVPVTCQPTLYPPVLQSDNGSMKRFPFGGNVEQYTTGLIKLWGMYAGSNFADPYASVLLAKPKINHSPVHITVSGCDALRDEGIAYALHLRNSGVDTQLEIIPGIPHGVNVSPTSLAASQFFRNQARALNCALNSDF
ncbi:alpha/beta hydrolase domain-containing protein [Xylogone sp. PMI_703]|nr:alpha/beta hydrolase domain-containing protein [Xylogone sp. PMI_703]